MAAWRKPTAESIERAISLLAHAQYYRYFFERLMNPEWVDPLWAHGFFANPPCAERDESGRVRYPLWPESAYLARMAKHKPDVVARIIKEMKDTDNVVVQSDLLDAILAMPPELAAQLMDKVKKWAEQPDVLTIQKLAELMVHLVKGEKITEALELAKTLLDLTPGPLLSRLEEQDYTPRPEPQAKFAVWHYRKILKEYYPAVVEVAGFDAFRLLCDLLAKGVRLSLRQDEGDDYEDYSWLWRRAIEDHPQDHEYVHEAREALVSAVRDTAEMLVSRNTQVEKVINELEMRRWKVFRRIALHLLRVFADKARDLVAQRLTNHALFEDYGMRHEYVMLLRENFKHLSTELQQTILSWIEKGPGDEDVDEGVSEEDEDIVRDKEIWQRDRLAWIGEENLPPDWKRRYRHLVQKHGNPQHPEFAVYWEFWTGPTSPRSEEELRGMSVDEIVRFLKGWKPPQEVFGAPSPEGLGRALSSVVAESPERFAAEAEEFQNLDPTYVRALLSGLRDGLKQGKSFDWTSVVSLCEWVVRQPRKPRRRRKCYEEADPDWSWARTEIGRLLSEGFEKESIPFKLRETVWGILEVLTDDPDPTPQYEEEYGGSNMDSATMSINTTRGVAMHAVIRYAWWTQHHLKDEPVHGDTMPGFAQMPEVREVLNKHLDISKEPSLTIRAVYGWWFPWIAAIDPDWAADNASRIFPLNEQEQRYFWAAWSTYLAFCPPYNKVFDMLEGQYLHALDNIGKNDEVRTLADPDERLAEHLMVMYWRGKIDLEGVMLTRFWQKAPGKLRAHAIGFVGRSLLQTEDAIPEDVVQRLKRLWLTRLEIVHSSDNITPYKEETAAFGWWFASQKLGRDWAIAQLLEVLRLVRSVNPVDLVIEKLVSLASDLPFEAVQCLDYVAKGEEGGWNIYLGRDNVFRILQTVMHSQNTEARKRAEELINYLGSIGFIDFRDLLTQRR